MMNVRARQKQRTTSPCHPLLTVLLLAAPVVFIFLFSVLFVGNDLSKTPIETTVNKTSTTISMATLSTKGTTTGTGTTTSTILYEKLMDYSTKKVYRYAAFMDVDGSKTPLSIRQWAELFSYEETNYAAGLASDLASILKEVPFEAFRFETKGCHSTNMDEKQFEFVLVNDSFLASFAASADSSAFSEHFRADDTPAVAFTNLGGDALLTVPQPLTTDYKGIYGHCANFMRGASKAQIAATWRLVAKNFLERVEAREDESVWLSTAGTGIAWLHFRLDDRPKYYLYQPFAEET